MMSNRPPIHYVPPHQQFLLQSAAAATTTTSGHHQELKNQPQQQHPQILVQSSILTLPTVSPGSGYFCTSVLEHCCYYTLQVVFVSGTLIGFAFIVTGAVLHAQRGELVVFVYIGVLVMTVSAVLLLVLCHVRGRTKRRRTRTQQAPNLIQQPQVQQDDAVRIPLVTFDRHNSRPEVPVRHSESTFMPASEQIVPQASSRHSGRSHRRDDVYIKFYSLPR